MTARSLVIYRGPSRFDPDTTIRAVLTPDSTNVKTGRMAQLYILPDATAPHETVDRQPVCGACPLIPSCYVVRFRGPRAVWLATNGAPVAGAGEIAGLIGKRGSVRLGADGDPAALPPEVIAHLVACAGGRVTGYTHGHHVLGLAGVEHLRACCMLSVETEDQARAAHAQGWRTFRPTAPGADNLASEITCPNVTRGTLCAECLLCRGAMLPRARSITVPVHGARKSRALPVLNP